MVINRVNINGFRNISEASLSFHPGLNIICGANGSGKTSLLESLSVVAHSKSFRSHLSTPLISLGSKSTSVFAEVFDADENSSHTIGVEKHVSKGTSIRLNRETVASTSNVARLLPVLVIDGSSFHVIEGGPSWRRKFLDWLVFHVKHQFHSNWLSYTKLLKQRNALLRRDKIQGDELAGWDLQLSEYGERVNSERLAAFTKLSSHFNKYARNLGLDIKAIYRRGWKDGVSLIDSLADSVNSDIQQKMTKVGPHRCDIELMTSSGRAADYLSRGQKKLALAALYLAVLESFSELAGKAPVVLIDDLAAELDSHHLQLVVDILQKQPVQKFVTSIEAEWITSRLTENSEHYLFHVKHGCVSRQN